MGASASRFRNASGRNAPTYPTSHTSHNVPVRDDVYLQGYRKSVGDDHQKTWSSKNRGVRGSVGSYRVRNCRLTYRTSVSHFFRFLRIPDRLV